jgi:hypothetical protein
VTTNSYLPANTTGDNWILGRLQFATQTNTVPVNAFAAPSAPMAANPPPAAPPRPQVSSAAAINAIINFLLLD